MNRVELAACAYFGPWILGFLVVLTRRKLRQRRGRRNRIPVAHLIARIEHERKVQATDRWRQSTTNLPPNWCWPSRDQDVHPASTE